MHIEIKPKLLVLLIIYVSLIYACNLAFTVGATYDNTQFGVVSPNTGRVKTDNMTAEETANVGGAVGFTSLFGLVGIGAFLGVDKRILTYVGLLVSPITTATGYGIGYLAGSGNESLIGVNDIFIIIHNMIDSVLNFILMLFDFMTFGVLNTSNDIPSIPYPFNLIPFIMTLPVVIIIFVWITSAILEAINSAKVPFAG